MDASRFDLVTKRFADRRLSRRQTLAGGASLAASALAAAGLSRATAAQDATPVADPPVGEAGPTMLFVQSFDSGSVEPAADGRFTLSLKHGLGQTLYFSDRPDRIVGAHPTQQFLDGLGFPEDNPPNAALLVDDGEGGVNIAVVELFKPIYDASGPNLTYEVAVLQDYAREAGLLLTEAPSDLSGLATEFESAHLFIDDCPDGEITCNANGKQVGTFGNQGHCYSWREVTCLPCSNWADNKTAAESNWSRSCNQSFPDCDGNCAATGVCTYGINC